MSDGEVDQPNDELGNFLDTEGRKLFMNFDREEGPDEAFHAHKLRLNKVSQLFWQRMSDMITGPEHEYVYLKRLVKRFQQRSEEEARAHSHQRREEHRGNRLRRKVFAGKGGATSPKTHAQRSPGHASSSPSAR